MRIVMVSVKKSRKFEIRIYAMYSYAEWPAKGKNLLQKKLSGDFRLLFNFSKNPNHQANTSPVYKPW